MLETLWKFAARLLVVFAAAILVLFVFVLGSRILDKVSEGSELPGIEAQLEVNSGSLKLRGLGVFPRVDRVLVAASLEFENRAIVSSRNAEEIKIVDLLSFEILHNYSFEDLGFRSTLGLETSELFLFDLEMMDDTKLYVSLVATNRSPETCDAYAILSVPISSLGTLSESEEVWRSDVCRSVVREDYGWPDFNGRMALDEDHIYLTSGLSSMNMISEIFPEPAIMGVLPSLAEELESNDLFGRITQINAKSGESRVYASGFRSPAGIAVRELNGSKSIWVSDHGSRGGDELNLVADGKNYGWPHVSLGTSYGLSQSATVLTRFLTHEGYESPTFSWTPSIAPSQVLVIEDSRFEGLSWGKGTLIMGTLKDESLRVLQIDDENRLLADERVELGHRIRDLAYSSRGIVASTDDGMVLVISELGREFSRAGMFPPLERKTWLDYPGISTLKYMSDVLLDLVS